MNSNRPEHTGIAHNLFQAAPRDFQASDITIAIPTYGRDDVLIDTIRSCLNQPERAGEILILDQTPQHTPEVDRQLSEWQADKVVRWERIAQPSIPAAMNQGLQQASKPLVLFLDDDILAAPGFVTAHAAAHDRDERWIVVGQIIQPWQQSADVTPVPCDPHSMEADFTFPFHSCNPGPLHNVMAGHMSVRRDRALQVGGFDQNFKGSAYRFETEFARRMMRAGGQIYFEPKASIQHLRAERGGTRVLGSHLTSCSPNHGVGDYYFALSHGMRCDVLGYCLRRAVREVRTRFHLRHPWYIPIKLLGELRAFAWACMLHRQGPALLESIRS